MPKNKNAIIRYMILDELLSDMNRFYTREMLTEKVNEELANDSHGYPIQAHEDEPSVSKRTIEKDLIDMSNIWGFELEENDRVIDNKGGENAARFKKTVRYQDPTFSIFKKPLSKEEKLLLSEVLNMLGQFSRIENFGWLEDLKERLAKKDFLTESENRKIIDFSANDFLKGRDHLTGLFYAISSKKTVKLVYQKFDENQPKEFIVFPYMLKQYNDRWYLLGTPINENLPFEPELVANFPLDRIESYEIHEKIPYRECARDIEEIYDNIIGMTNYENKPVEEIVVAVMKKSAMFMETKPIHGSQKKYPPEKQLEMHERFKGLEDYEFFHFQLKQNYEMESVFRGYGSNLVVLAPQSLRDAMLKNAQQQIDLYKMTEGVFKED